jgi:hypothetical protein
MQPLDLQPDLKVAPIVFLALSAFDDLAAHRVAQLRNSCAQRIEYLLHVCSHSAGSIGRTGRLARVI